METSNRFMDTFIPEEVLIVWYQSTLVNYYDDTIKMAFDQELTSCVKFFNDNIDDCIDFITNIKDEKIFLILPHTTTYLIALIEDLLAIKYIYVYSHNLPASHIGELFSAQIFRGFYPTREHLIQTIKQDVINYLNTLTHISLQNCTKNNENTSQNVSQNPNKFLWSRMILDVLLKVPSSTTTIDQQAMSEFVKECKLFYKNDMWVQKNIESYQQNYKAEEAIQWYTQTGFFFRLLNKGLRTQNIDIIFTFRSIIVDVFKQIQALYHAQQQKEQNTISSNLTTVASNILNVYRGQLMAYEEFQQIQQTIGGFIATNTFLSTTLDRTVALFFSGEGKRRPEYESVIFSIHIDKTIDCTKTPYANVQHLSNMQDEYEIILSVGTILKVDSIEKLENCWNIKLIVCNKEFEQHLNYFEQTLQHEYDKLFNDKHMEYPAILCRFLGIVLMTLGEFEKGIRYLCLHMNQWAKNNGQNEYDYCDIEGFSRMMDGSVGVNRALNWQDEFEPIFNKIIGKRDETCYLKGTEEISVHTYEVALLSLISKTSDLEEKSTYHHCLASLYKRQEKFEQALVHYEKILELKYAQSSIRDNFYISYIHRCIGKIYEHLGRPIEAIKHYNIELDYSKKFLPLNHFIFALIYKNIGGVYFANKDYHYSLKYFQQSSIILESSDDFRIKYNIPLVEVYGCIALVYFKTKKYEEALVTYKKIIELNLNPLRFEFYEAVVLCGESYFYLNDFDHAYEYYQKALDLLLKYHENRITYIAQAYDRLAYISQEQNKYNLAFDYFHKSLQYLSEESFKTSEEQCLPETLSMLSNVYKHIADCHSKFVFSEIKKGNLGKSTENIEQSLSNYKKALDLQVKYLPEGDLEIGYTKYQIATTYICMKRFQDSANLLEELLVTYSEKLNSDYKFHAAIYKDLSFAWSYMSDYDKARKCFEKAGSIIFDQPQPDEDLIKQYFQDLNDLDQIILQNKNTEISNSTRADKACQTDI